KIRAAHSLRRRRRKRRGSGAFRGSRFRPRHRRPRRRRRTDSRRDEPMTQDAAATGPERKPAKKKIARGLKFALELGPLVLFFVINAKWGIFTATAVLMLVVPFSLGVAWKLAGRMPVMPMVTAALVLVFGGLTLLLNDEEL